VLVRIRREPRRSVCVHRLNSFEIAGVLQKAGDVSWCKQNSLKNENS
jgi:hypothetical protein